MVMDLKCCCGLTACLTFSTASDIINDNMGGCINDSYYLLKERFV